MNSPATIAVISNTVASQAREPFLGQYRGHGPAFWHLIRIGRQLGLEFVLARRADWDGRSRTLRRGYTHDGQRWLVRRSVAFEAILPRSDLKVRSAPPIVGWNHRAVWKTCADKWLTYRRFRSISPTTWRVTDPAEVEAIRRRYPGQAFILKPRFGRQSRGVVVLWPRVKLHRLFRETPLLQRLIGGGSFLGRAGVWDIRCFVLNGWLGLSYLKRGMDQAPILNIHRSSRIVRFPLAKLPPSARRFVRGIDRAFERFRPRFYCIDFRYDDRRQPRLIELNHLPVLPWHNHPDYERFYRRFCTSLRAELFKGPKGKRS